MVREIIKDESFLANKSEVATEKDLDIAKDLLETLIANSDRCVGLAANMIGVLKCIIAIEDNSEYIIMLNPKILKSKDSFKTKESCLSLLGERETKRYKSIKVEYQNENMQTRIKTFKNFTAQIIQHEIDHCNGIII